MNKPLTTVILLLLVFFLSQVPAPACGGGEDQVKLVENGLLPPVLVEGVPAWTLEERMKHHHVPGVGIAVFKDFEIQWAKGYGVMDADTGVLVRVESLFQAASISKPVTSMAALHLVEKGKLSLDKNINTHLRDWKLPENEFTKEKKVTLPHLLSHSGGLSVSGFPGYAVGAPVPTAVQVLDGAPPANTPAIRVTMAPETRFSYSGGGYTIVQKILVDIEQKPFPDILKHIVLNPLGMKHSMFQQPLPPEIIKFAAAGHDSQGKPIPGKRHTYPEMAAAGLWTTPTDLARFGIEIQKSLAGKSNRVLSAEMTEKMVTTFVNDGVGLGLFLREMGDAVYFNHSGGNAGFRCILFAHRDKGYGAAVMTNAANGGRLTQEILRAVAHVYKWEAFLPKAHKLAQVPPEKLKAFCGRYQWNADRVVTVGLKDKGLLVKDIFLGEVRLFPVKGDKFVLLEQPVEITFATGTGGTVTGAVARIQNKDNHLKPVAKDFRTPFEMLGEGHVKKAREVYREIHKSNPKDEAVNETRLNRLGYRVLNAGKYKQAIALLNLNLEFYPRSANCCDSLAEAHMKAGNNREAIRYYRKALELLDKFTEENKTRQGMRPNILRNLEKLGKKKDNK